MAQHINFYKKQIEIHQHAADKLAKKLLASSLLRLAVFLVICLLVYVFWGNTQVIISSIIGGIALFVFLVSRHSDLKYKSDKQKAIIKLNQTEIDVMQSRQFQDLPDGSEFEVPNHDYAQDIDLFGRGSFFQYLNRTALYEGTKKLVGILLANDIESIQQKQEAVQELAEKVK